MWRLLKEGDDQGNDDRGRVDRGKEMPLESCLQQTASMIHLIDCMRREDCDLSPYRSYYVRNGCVHEQDNLIAKKWKSKKLIKQPLTRVVCKAELMETDS